MKIPENEFNEITFGDIAEVRRKNDNNEYIDLIYRFKKQKVNDPTKEKISKKQT